MYPFIFSAILTMFILLLDVYSKSVQPLYRYLAIFFLFAGFGFHFLSNSRANAEMFSKTYFAIDPISNQVILKVEKAPEKKSLKTIYKEFLETYKEKMNYHSEEGSQCLKQAENACLLFPNQTDQAKAFACFTTFFATLAPNTPKDKAIATLIAVCLTYGSLVMHEWQYIDTKLQQAKYHFEMEEHYRLLAVHLITKLKAEKK